MKKGSHEGTKKKAEAGALKSKRIPKLELGNEGAGKEGQMPPKLRKRKTVRPVGEQERILALQVEAVRLRSVEHLPYRDVALRLGVNVATAHRYVQEGLADLRADLEKNGFEIWRERFHSVEMLQGLIAKWYGVATAPSVLKERLEDGTVILEDGADMAVQASHVCIGAVKEIAKILGLNAAVKVAGKVDVNHRTPAPLVELAERSMALRSRSDLIAPLLAAHRN